jgi:hypothetical protein
MGDKFKKVLELTTIPRSRSESLDKAAEAKFRKYIHDLVKDRTASEIRAEERA